MNRWTMEIPGSKLLGPQVMEQTNQGSHLHGTGVSIFLSLSDAVSFTRRVLSSR